MSIVSKYEEKRIKALYEDKKQIICSSAEKDQSWETRKLHLADGRTKKKKVNEGLHVVLYYVIYF